MFTIYAKSISKIYILIKHENHTYRELSRNLSKIIALSKTTYSFE